MIDFNLNNNIQNSGVSNQKTILVVDWSNIMFRSLFLHKLFNGSSTGYEHIEDLRSFIHKFAMDICSIINTLHPAHTIICTDSQSAWRKQILPGENGYKANREKDPSVNWENIYRCSNDLLKILEKQGISIAFAEHAEADDIIACVKEVVFSDFPEYSMIVVSADGDIRQLIEFNQNTKQYCIVYNITAKVSTKKRHMYVTQAFKDWLSAPDVCDIFFTDYTIDNQKKYINDLLNTNQSIELVVDDPMSVLVNKVLCGDDGDNVPSFYSFYKNDRVVRVTPLKAKKLMELTGSKTVNDLAVNVGKISECLSTIFKRPVNDVDCVERLDRQRRLVELDSRLFPLNIREYKDSIKYMLKNIKLGPYVNLKSEEILKGTEYEGYDKRRALEADVFKDFEKMTGKSTFKKAGPVVDGLF